MLKKMYFLFNSFNNFTNIFGNTERDDGAVTDENNTDQNRTSNIFNSNNVNFPNISNYNASQNINLDVNNQDDAGRDTNFNHPALFSRNQELINDLDLLKGDS
jgi:hypothetical protein